MRKWRELGFAGFGAVAMAAAACTPAAGGGGTTNQAPTAVVGATPSTGIVPLDVTFSSAGSFDPEGGALTYSWNFGDGSAADTSANPSHTYSSIGVFTATLTVTDPGGVTGSASTGVTVNRVPNVAPTASISASPLSGKQSLNVSFDGTGSTDSDGSVVGYLWDFGDGATATTATASHTYTAAGPVNATLTVTDNDGATNTASQRIDVIANVSPIAVANGTPTSGKEPLNVAFSSAGSNDPDGSIVGYSWDFGDGTAVSTAANPNHTYASYCNCVATLTVTDDNGATATNTVTTSVIPNQAPTAVANATPSGGVVPLYVSFSSAGSTDPDGTIVTYKWDFNDGSFSTFPNPVHTYGAVGTYHPTLTVTDDNGVTNTDMLTISVNGIPNVPPTASASGTPSSGKVPLNVSFSSAGSTDTDGSIIGYSWDFGDGTSASTASPSHTYTTAGVKVATLTVTDNNGATASTTVQTTVNPNQAPSAVISAVPTSGKEPLTVSFSSSSSSDPDGSIVSRSWDFGDGGSSTASAPSHLYVSAGSYTARLTVTDDNGATATTTQAITVNANVKPTAVLNANPQSGARPLVVSFNSGASSDADGTIVSRTLNFGDGSPTSTATSTTHTYAAGSWTATVTVTDDNGATDTATQSINVVVDDDGDGYSPPTDCNDSAASTYPGAPDALDASGTDSNCDGVDGVLADSVLVNVTSGSDAAGCGLAVVSPCQTISTVAPVDRSIATLQSRSQLDPGKTMTAAFIRGL